MTDKPKRPRDSNQLAHMVVGVAIGEIDDTPPKKAEAQRKGGLKGGKIRAQVLPSKRRKKIATDAANARWRREPSN
jgi:hypothetical protein